MILSILIPQYEETEDIIKPMLDSIAHQINISTNDFEVIIGNDGSQTHLSEDFICQYHFPIKYILFEHTRLAGCRKNLFACAQGDYVMFCDADDRFINDIALSLIMGACQKECDALICDFYEEHILESGRAAYVPHSDDAVFVHGKVYRRQFLIENEIEWHPVLHEHQDSPYNVLARTCAKSTRLLKVPIYLWHDNPNSICRRNKEKHGPNTWPHMLDSYDMLIKDLQDRGFGSQSIYYSKYALYATYYEMGHEVWARPETAELVEKTYERIREFYQKYHLLIVRTTEDMTKKMDEVTLERAKRKGAILENRPSFDEWLQNVLLRA